ncbi:MULTISPECIES: S9 family peptidase [Bacillaceae]|uniref:S9 family peptidase n=1 Tax=Evansella alkalicola TaxID=745819 RepID=A0ABS6JR93_9BACI|nr:MULTISPECIES: S9 family peptidase [Bacillaceae]MBU9720940.1 S9 family peptidase [Bacillus alkalicola]
MKKYTIEQFINTETVVNNAPSANREKIIFTSDRSGVFNVYSIPSNGGEAKQLTNSKEDACYAISFVPQPGDNRFLYLSDQGGNEILHIYLQKEDGTTRDLTPDKEERATFFQWAPDGKSFLYGSNKRDPKFADVYSMDIDTFEKRLIFKNELGVEFSAISKDYETLALTKFDNANSSHMYIFHINTGKLEALTSHKDTDIQYAPQAFSEDGKYLYYITDKDHEFLYASKMHLETGEVEVVYKTDWHVEDLSFTHNHTYIKLSINRDAHTDVKIFHTGTNNEVTLPELPDGQITSVNFSLDEKIMTFLLNGSNSPSNLYVYNLEKNKLDKLTNTLNPEIDPADLVKAEVVRYPSFDGLEIPSIYYKPKDIKPGDKIPALVWVHGGPGGQSRVDYNPLLQYLANHGYAVIAVNNRGSSGYGKTFFKMADLKHGEVDLADCIESKSFLASTGYIDENRIGIIGGSYGGYMTLAALAFQPEEFQVGVDIFGVSNWVRTLKSIPSWWETMREALYKKIGDPFTSEEYLKSISPLFHADKIRKPLIVLQGSNDPRVLKVESDEIVDIVRNNGVPIEYLVFEDEGHGFSKKINRITGFKAILEFLNKHLKGKQA